MKRQLFVQLVLPLALVALGAARADGQAFGASPGSIPSRSPDNASFTEQVDFADVDLDGDWDAAFADGGDQGNDQNRIWINVGGLQAGTTGVFDDQTASRLPAVTDDSRDVEFADIDGDGDVDLHTVNTSQIVNQAARWWINQGGIQGGTLGYYVDDTANRWQGLGGPGSSILPGLVLASGGYINWSMESDFADLDNDGDLDLIAASYGNSFGGQSPTRVFLNDGAGVFSEFNPSGFQLAGFQIADGDPALWAEGSQEADTTDTTGAHADVAGVTADVEAFDHDGDLDIDVLLGDRDAVPRFFANRLEETGSLGFRDVSHLVFPVGWAVGGGTNDQETADVDADGDLDLFGLSWGDSYADRMFRNQGGVFGDLTTLPGTTDWESEGDFLDYDNDGDLDLFVCNFAGTNRLHRNDDTGSGPLAFTLLTPAESGFPAANFRGLDGEAADLDGDGDADLMEARDGNQANVLWENLTDVVDTTAPWLHRLEHLVDDVAGPAPRPVRVQVYDNAPYYGTWYAQTALEVTVEGCQLPDLPMVSSGGQIFRGELPGNLLGSVSYRARATDRSGNVGLSGSQGYTGTTGLAVGGPFGMGGAAGSEPEPGLRALSVALPETTLYLGVDGLSPGSIWILAVALAPQVPPITAFPSYTPAINVATVTLTLAGLADANGCGVVAFPLSSTIPPAASVWFQAFTSDTLDFAEPWAASRGLEVVLNP